MRTCEEHGISFSVESCPICAVEAQLVQVDAAVTRLASLSADIAGQTATAIEALQTNLGSVLALLDANK